MLWRLLGLLVMASITRLWVWPEVSARSSISSACSVLMTVAWQDGNP